MTNGADWTQLAANSQTGPLSNGTQSCELTLGHLNWEMKRASGGDWAPGAEAKKMSWPHTGLWEAGRIEMMRKQNTGGRNDTQKEGSQWPVRKPMGTEGNGQEGEQNQGHHRGWESGPATSSTILHRGPWGQLEPSRSYKPGQGRPLWPFSCSEFEKKTNLLQKAVVMVFLVIDSVKLGMRLPFRVYFGTQRF